MNRSVPEWVGRNSDSAIPPRVRLRVFDAFRGVCQCGCARRIGAGEGWDCDHIIALVNGGEHRESNLRPLIRAHHREKTKEDVAEKSRVASRRMAFVGIKTARKKIQSRGFDSPKGTCPVCDRRSNNLARHMERFHSGGVDEELNHAQQGI